MARGMFAFALFDNGIKKTNIGKRIGYEKPIYYGFSHNGFSIFF